jgi:hypothetical protein
MDRIETIAVGIVVERRESSHPWRDHDWRPVAVLQNAPPMDPSGPWRRLSEGEDWVLFHAGTLEVALYRTDTEAYRETLAGEPPSLFVVLREDEDKESGHEVKPFAATVSLYEAQDFIDAGDDIVERVPMPEEMVAWVRQFIDAHHKEEPFQKRKRRRHDEGKGKKKPARGRGSGWSEGYEF